MADLLLAVSIILIAKGLVSNSYDKNDGIYTIDTYLLPCHVVR